MKSRNELATPYPLLPFDPTEHGVIQHPGADDSVVCVCGNDTSGMNVGFAALGRETGLFANFTETPASDLETLGAEPAIAVCYDCGRCYDDHDLTTMAVVSPVVFRLDMENETVKDAVRRYWKHNGFGGWDL